MQIILIIGFNAYEITLIKLWILFILWLCILQHNLAHEIEISITSNGYDWSHFTYILINYLGEDDHYWSDI